MPEDHLINIAAGPRPRRGPGPRSPRNEGPCQNCGQKPTCLSYELLQQALYAKSGFQRTSEPDEVDRALDRVVDAFIESVRSARGAGWFIESDSGLYLSALFDLCATGLYANGVQNGGEFVAEALVCGGGRAFFPLTWMCPHCVETGLPLEDCYLPGAIRKADVGQFAFRDYPVVSRLAKPGGRAIGDFGIKILKAILRGLLARTAPDVIMRDGGGTRGEFDLTFASETLLVFAEVKAKPLIVYPLKLILSARVSIEPHEWRRLSVDDVHSMALRLAASGHDLPVSKPTASGSRLWPLPDLEALVREPRHLQAIVASWKLHLQRYRAWTNEPRDTRWHRFGCGNFPARENGLLIEKRVANTKELPGLDRTDDVKKGMAQLLKFARFKHDCEERALSCVLIGNTHAETHATEYVDPVLTLKIMRDGHDTQPVWLFDAIVGLTRNDINNPSLQALFDVGAVFRS